MPEFGINDLPDEGALDSNDSYELSGKSLRAMIAVIRQMWRGDNVNCPLVGGGIRKRDAGPAGFTLNATGSAAGLVSAAPAVFALQPGSDVSTHSTPKYTITYGTYGNAIPTIGGNALVPSVAANIITFASGDTVCYMQCNFTFDSSGNITISDAMITHGSSVPSSTADFSSMTGVVYQLLFGVTITAPIGMAPYKIAAAPAVGGSQNFGVCLPGSGTAAITGPWGV